jgi:hypothetical protein
LGMSAVFTQRCSVSTPLRITAARRSPAAGRTSRIGRYGRQCGTFERRVPSFDVTRSADPATTRG